MRRSRHCVRVAEIGDGWHGFNHLPETTGERRTLDHTSRTTRRSLSDVDITVCPYLQPSTRAPHRLPDAGVNQLVLTGFAFDADGTRTTIAELGEFVDAAANL